MTVSSSSFHSDGLLRPSSSKNAQSGGINPTAGATSSLPDDTPSPASTPVKNDKEVQPDNNPKVRCGATSASLTDATTSSPASTPIKNDTLQTNTSSASSSSSSTPSSSSIAAESSTSLLPLRLVRNQVFRLSALVGQLSTLVMQYLPLDSSDGNIIRSNSDDAQSYCDSISQQQVSPSFHPVLLQTTASHVWTTLWTTATLLNLHLPTCILQKMELNREKYPAHLVSGKAGKYTEYSDATGITKTVGQTTLDRTIDWMEALQLHDNAGNNQHGNYNNSVVQSLTRIIRDFAEEREWSKYHRPRNLILALMGELGELAELLQWNGDVDQTLSRLQLDKISQELADVAIYLLRFANVFGIEILENNNHEAKPSDNDA